MDEATWKVVGGSEVGGIIVREGQDTSSPKMAERLSTGALVTQIKIIGERLQYRLISGTGPTTGWVTTQMKGSKTLLERVDQRSEAETHDPAAERALRLAAAEKRAAELERNRTTMDDWRKTRVKESSPAQLSSGSVSGHPFQIGASSCSATAVRPQAGTSRVSTQNGSHTAHMVQNFGARDVPLGDRSRLACASPACNFLVNTRVELGAFCCIACSESNAGEHGLRCERVSAPKGCTKADPHKLSRLSGLDLEELELRKAIEESMENQPAAPKTVARLSGTALEELMLNQAIEKSMENQPTTKQHVQLATPSTQRNYTQYDLDMEEAIRLSMEGTEGESNSKPTDQNSKSPEERDLEEAIRISLDEPEKPNEDSSGSDEDNEPPPLVPLQ